MTIKDLKNALPKNIRVTILKNKNEVVYDGEIGRASKRIHNLEIKEIDGSGMQIVGTLKVRLK